MAELKDDELRNLFCAAGHTMAPESLRTTVLDRISVIRLHPAVHPLISKRQWLLAAAVLTGIVALAFYATGAKLQHSPVPDGRLTDLLAELHRMVPPVWLALLLTTAFAFTWMDNWLARTHAHPVVHR
ncbi:MAG: hypothetical protein KBH07_12030 [Flavobacteriales bacterium]|nr:hypothetical protein [Flavobacteriales bacterium]MBP9079619.1 hypothetical protein [Flavobacteriales bacterium]